MKSKAMRREKMSQQSFAINSTYSEIHLFFERYAISSIVNRKKRKEKKNTRKSHLKFKSIPMESILSAFIIYFICIHFQLSMTLISIFRFENHNNEHLFLSLCLFSGKIIKISPLKLLRDVFMPTFIYICIQKKVQIFR